MNNPLTTQNSEQLIEFSLGHLVGQLETHGNKLSEGHVLLLRKLIEAMTDFALGRSTGKKVFSLFTGGGKTSSIVSWIKGLHELGHDDISVLIGASKVEALCSLKRDLMAQGIPEGLIGLKHSQLGASLPSTGDESRRFQLVTHARIESSKDLELMQYHKGKPRSLLIYDESLLDSNPTVIPEHKLRGEFARQKELFKGREEEEIMLPFFDELHKCIQTIRAAIDTCRFEDKLIADIDLEIPSASREILEHPLVTQSEDFKVVQDLLGCRGKRLRLVIAGSEASLYTTRKKIPETFHNVLVLDASYPLRALIQLDQGLEDITPAVSLEPKRFDKVKVHQLFHPSGRLSVQKGLQGNGGKGSKLLPHINQLMSNLPKDKSILTVTFKKRPNCREPKEIISTSMMKAGINPFEITPNGKQRFNWLTWGEETSLNDFAHCEVVILVGLMHLPRTHLASMVQSQLGSTCTTVDDNLLSTVNSGELAHLAYQAMSRGSCRLTEDGQAKSMEVFLIHHKDDLRPLLQKRMPGLQWDIWGNCDAPAAQTKGKVDRLTMSVLEFLEKQPEDIIEIKTKVIKELLGHGTGGQSDRKAFDRAIFKVTQEAPWIRSGQSLVRVST